MNAKMSRQLTLLGLCAMAFYGAMLATGTLSLEVMPQFVVSALIFLTSGRLCKRPARARSREDSGRRPEAKKPADWELLTGLLNWSAAMLVLGVMALFIMKPVGIGFREALAHTVAQEQHFFAGAIP